MTAELDTNSPNSRRGALMQLRHCRCFRILLGIALLCAAGPSIVDAADAHQCALADAAEKRISVVLQLPAPCQRDDQCTVAHYGCPFPCASVVGASQRGILEATIKDYRRTQLAGECPVCKYKCPESP